MVMTLVINEYGGIENRKKILFKVFVKNTRGLLSDEEVFHFYMEVLT
ncbi:hypothetical protein IMSAGC004_03038 [Bacteroidaceae bacterium]|nr:hypothetical protein IMSAGC004_03038 [Bacteroidaceae bacterium]